MRCVLGILALVIGASTALGQFEELSVTYLACIPNEDVEGDTIRPFSGYLRFDGTALSWRLPNGEWQALQTQVNATKIVATGEDIVLRTDDAGNVLNDRLDATIELDRFTLRYAVFGDAGRDSDDPAGRTDAPLYGSGQCTRVELQL